MAERYRNKTIDELGGITAKLDREVDKHNGRGSKEFAALYEDYMAKRLSLAGFARLMGVSDETLRTSWLPLWERDHLAAKEDTK